MHKQPKATAPLGSTDPGIMLQQRTIRYVVQNTMASKTGNSSPTSTIADNAIATDTMQRMDAQSEHNSVTALQVYVE